MKVSSTFSPEIDIDSLVFKSLVTQSRKFRRNHVDIENTRHFIAYNDFWDGHFVYIFQKIGNNIPVNILKYNEY